MSSNVTFDKTPNTVLLTGGLGYIGSHTAVTLAEHGYEAILYDSLISSDYSVLDKISKIAAHEFQFVQGDIRDTKLLAQTMADYRVDSVIHFAGSKAVGESILNPIKYYSNNVHGSISVLEAMRSNQINKLIFSSSATVYGSPNKLPINEDHPREPISPYGCSKLYVEQIIEDMVVAEPDWAVISLRYFNPVGAHDSGLIGELPVGIPNNLMPHIAQVAAGIREELKIFGDDYSTSDGTGIRDYVHVMDVAIGHAAALKKVEQICGWHPINLGSGGGYSVREVVRSFESVIGKSIPCSVVGRRGGDVAECFAEIQRAREMLSWTPSYDLEDMCSSYWNFQKNTLPP